MNRFWRGMFAGMLLGTAVGMWLLPQMGMDSRERVMETTRGLANRAERMFQRRKAEMMDVMDK
ncbi:MAG: YtxH domain-containing protein [Bacillota bacterium]|nr:YtxH domain-containing protein [Bacillota bacterium]